MLEQSTVSMKTCVNLQVIMLSIHYAPHSVSCKSKPSVTPWAHGVLDWSLQRETFNLFQPAKL